MGNELVAAQQNVSLIARMAQQYGLAPKIFEETIRKTIMPGSTTNEEFCAFLLVCDKYKLNPILREIYAFPKKGGGISPIVGVDGWMNLVNSHPEMDGCEFIDEKENGKLVSITCKMYRKDRTRPMMATEYLSECKRNTDPWANWPYRMLRHKAYIQCARLAFGFAGIVDEDEADRSVLIQADVISSTPAQRSAAADLSDIKPVANAQRRSANDDHFAKTKADVDKLPVKAEDQQARGADAESLSPPKAAAKQSAPAAAPAAETTPAETKRGRGRPPRIVPNSPGGKPAEAPAPKPGVAPTEEPSQEIDEPGAVEADEPELAAAPTTSSVPEPEADDLDLDGPDDSIKQMDVAVLDAMFVKVGEEVDFKLVLKEGGPLWTKTKEIAQAVARASIIKKDNKGKIVESKNVKVDYIEADGRMIVMGLSK